MKIVCELEPLREAFGMAASAVHLRSPKAILQNVLLTADKTVTLVGTDLEIGVRADVEGVTVERSGSVALPAQRVNGILRELSDQTVVIEATKKGVEIRGERTKFELPLIDTQDFPPLAEFTGESYVEIGGVLLREMFRRTTIATDDESSRYAFSGVLVECAPNKIIAVATDGSRMALMEGTASYRNCDTFAPSVIPAKAANLISRLIATDGDVKLAIQTNEVLCRTATATVYSRLVEGRFPRWRDVVPDRKGAQAEIPLVVGPVLSVIRQVALTTGSESEGVNFDFGDGKLVLQSSTADIGAARAELPIAADAKAETALKCRYVADFLKTLKPDAAMTCYMRDPNAPVLFTTDDGYSHVIMPLARSTR